ncbi:oxidoreductase [Lutimaribacter saemankumensis]|uniref:Oxidoreductase molybdopterin-binding domain-containing protein n=1 Tax=Lutimaribacter saemankumensis TaxID=490829 RepID=A0A1G8GIQ9_9RHOB|nr:oxidoreductase [Lutimaribacter saemankumensis]SDH94252.1 hypothetical protein SAMN05421850_101105 [Lutimaribacter saemankumensis]
MQISFWATMGSVAMVRENRSLFMVACAALHLLAGTAQGMADCHMPPPQGRPLLEIHMGLAQAEQAKVREVMLDDAMLRALPAEDFSTTTIWTDGVQHFRGVRLLTLVRCLGIENGLLTLTAKNEYLIEIPVEDLRPDGALVAYERNGKPMATRDKGPLWLVYPYDSHTDFQTETIYAQSIWQLDRIEVTP